MHLMVSASASVNVYRLDVFGFGCILFKKCMCMYTPYILYLEYWDSSEKVTTNLVFIM